MVEIEAKLKVDALEPIAQNLAQIGATAGGEVVQTDYYFDDKSGSLSNSDKALRLRHEVQDKDEKVILAYKGPREGGAFKRRQEVQFGVDNVQQVIALLSALGYEKTLVVQKRRKLWYLEGCEIALDDLPQLGTFVEIEGPSEQAIAEVQKRLGLEGHAHVKESYAVLMQKIKNKK